MKTNISILILAVAAHFAFANGDGKSPMAEALSPYIDDGRLPGAISILAKPGREDIAIMGWADVSNRVPMGMDRMFQQCSQTKGFCGVTVAILVEEGKLSLEDPIEKYLPQFSNMTVRVKHESAPDTFTNATNKITVRMVMNHTAGFPFEIPPKEKGGWSCMSLADTAQVASGLPLLFEPGTQVKYSNTGIDIGAAVVEKVAGVPWEKFLVERVLMPLGMTDTTFWPTDEQLARRVKHYSPVKDAPAKERGYHEWMPPPWNGPTVFPSAGAGLWTTAQDQFKFYSMLMNLGLGENGVRILKEETVRNLLASSTREGRMGGYSLGLEVKKDGWFGHGGAWNTYATVNWKKKYLFIWVVQNLNGPRPWDKVRDRVKDAFFVESPGEASEYTGRLE